FPSQHRARDGRIIPVEISSSYLAFNGKEYSCAYVRDITMRKQEEEQQRLVQFMIENAGEAVFWVSRDLKFGYANKAACLMLGYTREELLGMHLSQVDEGFSEVEAWPETWEQMKLGNGLNIESSHRTKDGRIIPIEVKANYLAYDGKEYACAFVRDTTDRRRAEAALRASEERYRAFVTQSSEGIWRLELDTPLPVSLPEDAQILHIHQHGFLAECNDVMARMHGFSHVEEIEGLRASTLFDPAKPEHNDYLRAFIRSG